MAKRRFSEKIFDSVVHGTTLTSSPASWAKLGEMDTVRFEIRTSQAPSPNDAFSVWIEDSNDGVNWNTIVQPVNGQTLSQNTNQQFWASVGGPNDPFRRYLRVRVLMSGTANIQVFAHARADQTITLDDEVLYDDVLHGAGPFYTSPDAWQRLGAADACAWQASISMGSTNSTLTVALETSIDGIFWAEATSKAVPYTASTNVYGFGAGTPNGAYARFKLSQVVNDTCRVALRVTARSVLESAGAATTSASCAGCAAKGACECAPARAAGDVPFAVESMSSGEHESYATRASIAT